MNEYLDAAQVARLEAIKLIASRSHREWTVAEIIAAADSVARFITDGTVPDVPEEPA